jgi:hypothetical protein
MNAELKTAQKPWTKPELTVLVRNYPEEQVLTGCKVLFMTPGPNGNDMDCVQTGPGACENCASLLGS